MIDKIKKYFGTAHQRAILFDKLAKWFIKTGGSLVIIAVIGILVFILYESLPLLYGADSKKANELTRNSKRIITTGINEYQNYAYVFTDSLTLEIIELYQNKVDTSFTFNALNNRKIISVDKNINSNIFALGMDSGYVANVSVIIESFFDEKGVRQFSFDAKIENYLKVDQFNRDVSALSYAADIDDNPVFTALCDNDLILYSIIKNENLFGEIEIETFKTVISEEYKVNVNTFTLDNSGSQLAVVNHEGELLYFDISDKEEILKISKIDLGIKSKLFEIEFLVGDQSIVIGDESGNVSTWMKVLDEKSPSGWRVSKTHEFESMAGNVTSIAVSNRSKNFIVSDNKGNINLYYLTSERTLVKETGGGIEIRELAFSPKSDGMIVRYDNGIIANFEINNPHPEISLGSLFGKVWYEGYAHTDYVWQSTGGDDSFESKFNLIPLVFGTLKGTMYAMLFAVPLALMGALYSSTFSSQYLKNKIKPVVELMAALPSVVIGFLAGLWLAPIVEENFPGIFLMFLIQPVVIVVSVLIWRKIKTINKIFSRGYEVLLIIPLIIVGVFIAFELGPWFERIALNGDYRLWLDEYFGMQYDQRNSIVVGFAMGFAVIPIIFTICEDSLSSVPQHLTSASLALGANKWQTAIRVVLPTASPGIFSAIMIGLGRAIGETMIVLMATGNTPIMDWSPFNGMRTLSANIAVEIPEAPYHGTLYRVLFVSAGLLFVLTFIVNTVAEIIRQRLRKKYMHV